MVLLTVPPLGRLWCWLRLTLPPLGRLLICPRLTVPPLGRLWLPEDMLPERCEPPTEYVDPLLCEPELL